MLGNRGPPYSALIYSVDASGFEQTDVNNSKIVRSHICGLAMMHVTLQLQSQRVVFGARLKSQIIIIKHKSF